MSLIVEPMECATCRRKWRKRRGPAWRMRLGRFGHNLWAWANRPQWEARDRARAARERASVAQKIAIHNQQETDEGYVNFFVPVSRTLLNGEAREQVADLAVGLVRNAVLTYKADETRRSSADPPSILPASD